MKTRKIIFTDVRKVAFLEDGTHPMNENTVLIKTEYTAVSAGTERAVLLGMQSVDDVDGVRFPKVLGYSCAGHVVEVGRNVKSVAQGDRVIGYWSQHSEYNVLPESQVVKIADDKLPSEHAVFLFIASFSAAALRKTRLEFGESAMVFGVGILGAFAIQLCRAAGAVPVIAADLSAKRRQLALSLGADYAFDPTDEDFTEKVKAVTKNIKGVNAVIEVTGLSSVLNQVLDVTAPMGRVALLGCTRVSDTLIDFYQKVHLPGIELIGAHTFARPQWESYPHYWTHNDDIQALMRLVAGGRMDISKILSEIHAPTEAPEVFHRLVENKDFPVGVLFDWKKV